MAHYDYRGLTGIDFENLVQSLLQAELEITLEAFAAGKDSGIDLRYSRDPEKTIIVQCKHYAKSGFSTLLGELKRKEKSKIAKLNPIRYIIVTTVALTPSNKDEILDELNPYIKNKQDIYGENDVTTLLEKFPQIAQQNIKLYITSWALLSRALNNDLFCSATFVIAEARKKAKFYVKSDLHDYANQTLENEQICLISGPPGVGKTTLAEMLLLQYESKGWEVFSITNDINNVARVYNAERNQIFFYDDFLGQISSTEKLGKNEDALIAQIIRQISGDVKKRLLLTTREYILRDAQRQYENLARINLKTRQCTIECYNYDDSAKASILYNHIYHSELPPAWIQYLGNSSRFDDLIFHQGFTPRLVESIIEVAKDEHFQPDGFLQFFIEKLNFPDAIWDPVFLAYISPNARGLLLVLASIENRIALSDLKALYHAITGQISYDANLDFNNLHRIIERTFVRTDQTRTGYFVNMANPSVRDYLTRRLALDVEAIRSILNTALFFAQPDFLWRLSKDQSDGMKGFATELKQGLTVSCRTEFVDSIKRTIMGPALRGGRDFDTSLSGAQEPFELDQRFIEYCRIMDEMEEPVDKECLRRVLAEIVGAWTRQQANVHFCMDVINLAMNKISLNSEELDVLVVAAKEIILSSEFDDVEGFDVLTKFGSAFSHSVNEENLKTARPKFEKWIYSVGYPTLERVDPEELAEAIRWITDVANFMRIHLDESALELGKDRLAAYAASEHVREMSGGRRGRMVISRITSVEFGNHVQNLCSSLANYP